MLHDFPSPKITITISTKPFSKRERKTRVSKPEKSRKMRKQTKGLSFSIVTHPRSIPIINFEPTKNVNQSKKNGPINVSCCRVFNAHGCASRTHPRICFEDHSAQNHDHACIAFFPCTSSMRLSIIYLTCDQNKTHSLHFLMGGSAFSVFLSHILSQTTISKHSIELKT